MLQTMAGNDLHDSAAQRAEELFQQHQQAIFKSTDRLFAGLMLAQWLGGIGAAFYFSPQAWAGQNSQTHLHVWAAIFLGGAISIFPIALAVFYPGFAVTRYIIAVAQMLMSGLLIHLTGGRIETHFHIFGSLAFLAFYRDWRVLIPATLVTCLDHFGRGIYWPESIYGVLSASPWRTLEHVGWVLFEDVFLVVASLRSVQEMRAISRHTAQLEITNHLIEEKVVQRTAEVKASEERFRLLMDGVQDYAIIMLDCEGRVVSWNEGARRVKGYLAEEILGRDASCFYSEEDIRSGVPFQQLLVAKETGRFENEGWRVRQDGSKFWANAVFTALYDEHEQLRGYSKVTRDITERKQAEDALLHAHNQLEMRVKQRTAELASALEELQVAKIAADAASDAKSEFLSRMSHELRTPLNAILGFGQLLEMENLEPGDQESVEHILKSGRHLLALINEVLDIARVEAGRMDLNIESVRVGEVLAQSVDLIQTLASDRQVHLEANGALDSELYAWADPQRLNQILINLLSNAVKYNQQGGQIEVFSQMRADRVRMGIRDTGLGIAPEHLSKLFTPFERLDAAQTNIEGTGLGLALSKRMVEAMGGLLEVESTPGQGSTFYLELPASEDQSEEATQQVDLLQPEVHVPDKLSTVLLIEDNISNYRLVEGVLKHRPHIRLLGAMQGSLGVEMAQLKLPDVILLDLNLPDISGEEVLRRLRESSATAGIPVIVLSADATPRQIQRLTQEGVDAYLTKPLHVKELLRVLDETLDRPASS
jgi:PAS domain S-box-containing protein